MISTTLQDFINTLVLASMVVQLSPNISNTGTTCWLLDQLILHLAEHQIHWTNPLVNSWQHMGKVCHYFIWVAVCGLDLLVNSITGIPTCQIVDSQLLYFLCEGFNAYSLQTFSIIFNLIQLTLASATLFPSLSQNHLLVLLGPRFGPQWYSIWLEYWSRLRTFQLSNFLSWFHLLL